MALAKKALDIKRGFYLGIAGKTLLPLRNSILELLQTYKRVDILRKRVLIF